MQKEGNGIWLSRAEAEFIEYYRSQSDSGKAEIRRIIDIYYKQAINAAREAGRNTEKGTDAEHESPLRIL